MLRDVPPLQFWRNHRTRPIVPSFDTEKNVLLRQEDFSMSQATKMSFGPLEDLSARVLERMKRVPAKVRWGTAERNIRVASSQGGTTMARVESESESEENGTGDRETYGGNTPRKQDKNMWVGGYYVDKYRRCGCGNIWTARQMLQGFLNNKPKWLKTNFLHAEENVRVPDFHKDSCYYSSPRRPNGFDGVDSVHIAFICAHGGTSPGVANICMFDKNRACGNATSNNMSLGQKNLRYLFMSSCDLLPIANPAGGWFPAAKGVRALFGASGTSYAGGGKGKFFWQNWKRSRPHRITHAWLDAAWRACHKNVPVALWFGPDEKTVREMCEKEAQFHFASVQPNYAYWQYYSCKPIRRRKDVDLISSASVVFKPVEENSALPSLLQESGLVEKGSLQMIDKESNEDTTTYYSLDNGPTLLVNRSSGSFDLTLPEFETKGSVEYGDDEAISVASAYCNKIRTQLKKGVPLESESVSTEIEPCEIRYTVQGSSSSPAQKSSEQITQTCVVFRPIINGLPTIGTGGVLEVTLNAAKQVCRVRSVLREVASVTLEKSFFDPHSLESLAKQRALDDVRQMTGDEDCRVESVELGYFAADEAEIQKVSRPSFQVEVESGTEPVHPHL